MIIDNNGNYNVLICLLLQYHGSIRRLGKGKHGSNINVKRGCCKQFLIILKITRHLCVCVLQCSTLWMNQQTLIL